MDKTWLWFAISVLSASADVPGGYKGTWFRDSVYLKGPQEIPGRIQAAYYDLGGEGVAYHDADLANHGSGELNYSQKCPDTASNYVCHFREKDATDPSYTKSCCDFSAKNFDTPPRKQFYIGWQADGEWLNYTVRVRAKGSYKIKAMYGFGASVITFKVNNSPASTAKFPINTGSPHVWKYADSIGVITFPDTGLFLLTYMIAKENNTAYFDFVPAGGPTDLISVKSSRRNPRDIPFILNLGEAVGYRRPADAGASNLPILNIKGARLAPPPRNAPVPVPEGGLP